MNNASSARAPLQPVAELSEVIMDQIHGLIKRDGQGPFVLTEKGKALQELLKYTPEAQQTQVMREFLRVR